MCIKCFFSSLLDCNWNPDITQPLKIEFRYNGSALQISQIYINSLRLIKMCFPYNLQPSPLPYLFMAICCKLGFWSFLMKTLPLSTRIPTNTVTWKIVPIPWERTEGQRGLPRDWIFDFVSPRRSLILCKCQDHSLWSLRVKKIGRKKRHTCFYGETLRHKITPRGKSQSPTRKCVKKLGKTNHKRRDQHN